MFNEYHRNVVLGIAFGCEPKDIVIARACILVSKMCNEDIRCSEIMLKLLESVNAKGKDYHKEMYYAYKYFMKTETI